MVTTINDDIDDIDDYDQDDAHDDDHDYDSRQSHSQFPSRLIHNAHSWFWNSLFNLRKTDQMRLVILDAIVGGEAVFFWTYRQNTVHQTHQTNHCVVHLQSLGS